MMYAEETAEIPAWLLDHAVRHIIRSHHWPRLPVIADVWEAAKTLAGMKRERYRAGRYLKPESEWPPEGRRYAVTAGDLESIDAPGAPMLPAQTVKSLGAG